MKQKKKLLFIIESLALAGSEKSLIALLSNLDSEKYEIDLQLFRFGAELEKFIPSYVNVLPALPYTKFTKQSFLKSIFSFKFSYLIPKGMYSLKLRKGKRNHSEIAMVYWQTLHQVFDKQEKRYDVAIAFAQGVPTFYVADKINSIKKIAWINANMQFTPNNLKFQHSYYSRFDQIICISKGTREHTENIFPDLSSKFKVIPNIIDFKSISKLAQNPVQEFKTSSFSILTVGRLDNGMKGMDITLETALILKNNKIDFHWFIIGAGPFRNEMEDFIESHDLKDKVSLLGSTDNPYPYFKAADLYVQTSRHEGYGRTIAEARMLNVPIVTTCFDTVYAQMVQEKNGLVTDMNPEAVAKGIERMMTDTNLYQSVVEYLKQEPKENTETVKKFDAMIEELFKQSTA